MNDMFILNATDFRKEFSQTIDSAIREKPQFIKRTRDHLFLADFKFIDTLLSAYTFTAKRYVEDDGSVTLSLNEIDLAENSETDEAAKMKLAKSILQYAEDYYNEFEIWNAAPNRKGHIPFVFKALLIDDVKKIGELIQCQDGEN
jgi:hypothetical protein